MMDQNLRAARSDAHTWQADARSRLTDPPTADDLDRARLEQLGQTCPGAQMAGAVLSITGWPPVAIDPDRPQEPSSGPLTTPGEVWHHYRHRNADGAGLRLGSQPGGVSLVAVHGTAKAWSDWYAEHAVEASKARYEDGSGKVTSYRDAGRFTAISWQPPPSTIRSTGVAVGRVELDKAAEAMRPRHVGASEVGWLVWAHPAGDRRLSFPDRRRLGPGLDVLGQGVVPLHAVRGDGWRVQLSGLPLVEEMPSWLVAEFGGRYGKHRA